MNNSKENPAREEQRQSKKASSLSASGGEASKHQPEQAQREYARNLNLVRWGLAFFCLVYAGTYLYQWLEEDAPNFTPPELAFAAVLVGAGLMLSWKLGQKRAEVLTQLALAQKEQQIQREPSNSGANPPDKTNDSNEDESAT